MPSKGTLKLRDACKVYTDCESLCCIKDDFGKGGRNMADFDYSRFMQESNTLLCAPQNRCQISYDMARGPAIKGMTGAVVALSVIIMLFLLAFCGSWMYFRNKINLSKQ